MERGNQGCSAHLAEGKNDKRWATCTATLITSYFKRWSNFIVVKTKDPLATKKKTVYDLTNTHTAVTPISLLKHRLTHKPTECSERTDRPRVSRGETEIQRPDKISQNDPTPSGSREERNEVREPENEG